MSWLNNINFKAFDKNHRLRSTMMKLLGFLPDGAYLKFVFKLRTGKKLNLKHPVTFCDKQNWLKIHEKEPRYTQLVDKLAVRSYVADKIGEDHLFPLLGAWDSFDEIDFDALPEAFVLKCNHDSGSVKIINHKSELTEEDVDALRKHFTAKLKANIFYAGREYPYKNIKPCILAEKLMVAADGKGINDYKFFCFNGKPEILFIATDRTVDVKFDFFDMDFNHLDIINIHPQSGKQLEKPQCFEEMKEIAAELSEGMKFVRLDLYEVNGKVYFGEFTFFHGGGFWPMTPDIWEKKLGDLIEL